MSFETELADVARDIVDTMATGTITLRSRSGGDLIAQAGAYENQTVESVDVPAVRLDNDDEIISGAFGRLGAQESGWIVRTGDLSGAAVRDGWYVIEGGTERRITMVSRECGGHALRLICRSDR